MKTLFIAIAMLCLLPSVSNAQIAFSGFYISSEIISTFNAIKKYNPEILELSAMIAEKHTESAEKQLKSYLSQSLKYSEILIENGIEGEVLVAVEIATDGTLTCSSILKSPHSEVTKMVEQSLRVLTAVNFKDQWYRGLGRVEIPLSFSLR